MTFAFIASCYKLFISVTLSDEKESSMAENGTVVSDDGFASTGNVDWSVFLQKGVIITLTIKRYRGTATVDFSELGINAADEKLKEFLGEYIQPGQKKLIPPDIDGQLKSIETSARNNLKEKSFDCSAFASSGKFVPETMYAEFKATNEELKNRFYEVRDEFSNNYDNIVDKVCGDYKVLAENLYMQSHPAAKRPSAKYVNQFVDKIREQIPTAEEICASFEYTTVLRRIPDYLLKAIRSKNNIDEKVMRIAASNQNNVEQVIRERRSATEELDDYKQDETKQNTPRNETIATDEGNSSKTDVTVSSGKHAGTTTRNGKQNSKKSTIQAPSAPPKGLEYESIDEIERDIRESMNNQSRGMADNFISDIKSRLCTDAASGAKKIVESIDKNNGKLVGRASIKAQSLVRDLRKMNFYKDQDLDECVAALESSLECNEETGNRDVAEIRKAANELRIWSETTLAEISAESIKKRREQERLKRAEESTRKRKQQTRSESNNGKSSSNKKTVKISTKGSTTRRRTIKSRS